MNGIERVTLACVNQSVSYFFSHSSRIEQSEPEREAFAPDAALRLKRAEPIGALHVDRLHSQSMTLRVFHQRRRIVKTHGLVVQHGRRERRQIVALEIGAGIGNQREAGRVRFRKSIQREGRDRLNNLLLRIGANTVGSHSLAQLDLQFSHSGLRTAHAHGPPQFFRFSATEVGDDHRHANQLFLKERHSERSFQHRLQQRMRIGDQFFSLPPFHIRVHHLAYDRPRADDGHLHHQIVKTHRAIARQRRHLRAAFDLEHAHGVGPLQRAVDFRIVLWKLGEIERLFVMAGDQIEAIFEHGHHPEPEQIDLDDLHVGAVFLVPLNNGAPRHRRRFDGNDRIELASANHHAAGVLPEVAGNILHALANLQVFGNAAMLRVEACRAETGVQGIGWALPFPCAHQLGEAAQRLRIEAERLARFARGRPSSVSNDIGGHRRAQFAIALVHVLNGAFTAVAAGQIEIDIRPFATLGGEEPFEEQLHADRIDRRKAERITHHAVCRRSAALNENALAPAELHDVPNDQEITREFQLTDQRQFAASLLPGFLEKFRVELRQIPFAHTFLDALLQKRLHGAAIGHGIAWEAVSQIAHLVSQARGKLRGVSNCLRKIAEHLLHLPGRAQVAFGIQREQAACGVERRVVADAG